MEDDHEINILDFLRILFKLQSQPFWESDSA